MRRLLLIVAVLAVVFAGGWGIGYMLPLDHTAKYAAVLPAGEEAVWQRIADVNAQPTWRKGLTVAPAASQNGRPCWHETAGKLPILMCVEASTPPRLREVSLASQDAFHGTWVYELEPVSPTQTRVRMTENVLIYRPSWRFLMLFLGRDFLSRQVMKQLAASFGGKPIVE